MHGKVAVICKYIYAPVIYDRVCKVDKANTSQFLALRDGGQGSRINRYDLIVNIKSICANRLKGRLHYCFTYFSGHHVCSKFTLFVSSISNR